MYTAACCWKLQNKNKQTKNNAKYKLEHKWDLFSIMKMANVNSTANNNQIFNAVWHTHTHECGMSLLLFAFWIFMKMIVLTILNTICCKTHIWMQCTLHTHRAMDQKLPIHSLCFCWISVVQPSFGDECKSESHICRLLHSQASNGEKKFPSNYAF